MFKRTSGARAWILGLGGVVGIASGVLSYADIAKLVLPLSVANQLPLIMIGGFACALWALGSDGTEVDDVLYREVVSLRQDNTKLQQALLDLQHHNRGRVLAPEDSQAIARSLRSQLNDLRDACIQNGWSLEDASQTLAVRVIALGTDRENLSYRNQLASALEDGGFETLRDEFPTGAMEHEPYLASVTVAAEDPHNVVRPFVFDALRDANINVREDEWPPLKGGSQLRDSQHRPAATVFVGQLR